ncbi:hypothetical protein BDM02DRAFT_3189539 [Thelephora ganbajun]|uniref:Uncharacterized protein n=1 Tax=Thelephora ganbajun TaxID=370292 RepID=A0ACB6Z7G9_THEGA|nr:hypothetical protein BDM02DRAFT_3189539 [Thelephora ganbajun]
MPNLPNYFDGFERDVGGLKRFLEHGRVPNRGNPSALDRVTRWAGDSAMVVGLALGELSQERKEMFVRRMEEDSKKQTFAEKIEMEERKRRSGKQCFLLDVDDPEKLGEVPGANNQSPRDWTMHPIELVSPIFRFTPNDPFQDHVHGVLDCIEPPCAVRTNDSCGTRIYVSPSNLCTLAQIKAVVRAVLHFEPAINALVPPHRLNNMWCKTFFLNNANFQDTDVAQAIAQVDGAGSLKAIVDLMHPPPSTISLYLIASTPGTSLT